MKRRSKIALWVIGAFVALCVVTLMSADMIASFVVHREVRKTIEQLPDAEAQVGGIYLNLLSGSAIVKDITFCTHSLHLEDTITGNREPGLALHIPTLAVWNLRYKELLKNRHLSFQKISIDDLQLLVYLDEKHPESLLPTLPKDTTLEKAPIWLRQITARRIEVNDLKARLHSTSSPLAVRVEDMSVGVRDIHYSFEDSVFSFNDSVYALRLEEMKMQMPDGLMEMELHAFKTENAGPLSLGYTRIRHIVTVEKLVELFREPLDWIDLELNGLSTSAFNPIHKIQNADYTLDSLHADVRRMHLRHDARCAPKHPYGTPQDFLRQLPVSFQVKQVNANVHAMDIYFYSTQINCGEMHLKNARGLMTNVTNRPGALWHNRISAPFGDKGHMDAVFDMHMNKNCDFKVQLHGTNIETHDINSFIRPLVGITCECHIDDLDAQYEGDHTIAKGEFCMQYHGLNIQVHKEDDIPYKIVTKNADTFTTLANSLIPKSNPTAVDIAPRRYQVSWKRDIWSPYPLFVFGPCIDGVKETMLPGLYVHKQAKKKK